jgi:aconitate hydratase
MVSDDREGRVRAGRDPAELEAPEDVFADGDDPDTFGLTGEETYDILGLEAGLESGASAVTVRASDGGREPTEFEARVRLDTEPEREAFLHGGILKMVLREMVAGAA